MYIGRKKQFLLREKLLYSHVYIIWPNEPVLSSEMSSQMKEIKLVTQVDCKKLRPNESLYFVREEFTIVITLGE